MTEGRPEVSIGEDSYIILEPDEAEALSDHRLVCKAIQCCRQKRIDEKAYHNQHCRRYENPSCKGAALNACSAFPKADHYVLLEGSGANCPAFVVVT